MPENKQTYTKVWSVIQKIKTSLFSREVLIFLFFVLLSSVLWILHSLSKVTEIKIIVPITYTGIPENIEVIDNLPSSINVKIKDQGSNLVAYIFYKIKTPININLESKFSNETGQAYLLPKDLKKKVLYYIDPTATLIEINPDTILIKYVHLYKKNIPVKIAGTITLAQQYMLSENITITPSQVSVYGRKSVLDTLRYVYTKQVNLQHINDTINQKISIQTIPNLKYNTSTVSLFIPVEMYTEKILTIPITTKHIPSNIQVRTFPSIAKVTCRIGLSRFNDLSTNDFDVSVDYMDIVKNKTGKQILNTYTSATYISNLQVTPKEVEFILENKK